MKKSSFIESAAEDAARTKCGTGTGWFFRHDKTSVDIMWRRDDSFEDVASVLDPDILAREFVEDATRAWLECLVDASNRASEITP